jgi:hypothetical protein
VHVKAWRRVRAQKARVYGKPEAYLQATRLYSWWKRHLLYLVIAVKEIMVSIIRCYHILDLTGEKARILPIDKATNRISAVVKAFHCTDNISQLAKAKSKILSEDIKNGECGIDIKGQRRSDGDPCFNAGWDEEGEEEYCKLKHLDYLDLKHDKYHWLTAMFEYYRQTGIDKNEMAFLQAAGFVISYEYVLLREPNSNRTITDLSH